MKKNDYIVAFNSCVGLFLSLSIPFIIYYTETLSHCYHFPPEILYIEYLSYALLLLSVVPDILLSCRKISQAIKGLVPLIFISPLLLSFVLNHIFISEHGYLLEAFFPLGITLTYLFHEIIWKRFLIPSHKDTFASDLAVECSHCQTHFPPNVAFCPNCQTISPKVLESYNKYPQKHYLDFTEDIVNSEYVRCPHCKVLKHGSSSWLPARINSPFFCCGNCNEFYTQRGCYEWSVISTLRKIQFCFIGGEWPIYFFFGLFICYSNAGQSLPFAIALFILLISLRILWIRGILSFDIRASKNRLKANPEYPKILADMGYEILDDKYKIQYKKTR